MSSKAGLSPRQQAIMAEFARGAILRDYFGHEGRYGMKWWIGGELRHAAGIHLGSLNGLFLRGLLAGGEREPDGPKFFEYVLTDKGRDALGVTP